MRRVFISSLFFISVCACSTPSEVIQDGNVVKTPPQWVKYCEQYPTDPAC